MKLRRENILEFFTQCNFPHLVLNDHQLNETKELLIKFIEFTEQYNIPYFAIGGTLLGSIRNGGLLPFDDDIDVGVLDNYEHYLINYKDDTYYFEKVWYGYKFKKKISTMFIDVMIFEKKDNKYKIINNSWPEYYFEMGEIFPLNKRNFSGIDVNIPAKPLNNLTHYYPNWEKKIKIDCGHHKKNDKCIYETNNIPQEFDVTYDNSKYLCYTML